MHTSELVVAVRSVRGKGAARCLRRQGRIPGIIYGRTVAATSIDLDPNALLEALSTTSGENTLIRLRPLTAGSSLDEKIVLLKDYQVHPIRHNLIHADFIEVDLNRPMRIELPVTVVGKAAGEKEGGILHHERRAVEVECLPKDIPLAIEVKVNDLNLGQSIHVSDLLPPPGVTIKTDGSAVVVRVTLPDMTAEATVAAPTATEDAAATVAATAATPDKGDKKEAKDLKDSK